AVILQIQEGSPVGQVGAAKPQQFDIVLVLRIGVIEVDHLLAVEPVLNHGTLAHDPAIVPLADGPGNIAAGGHAEVQTGGAGAGILAVDVLGVVENLVLVLAGPIVHAAVAAFAYLPLKTQLKIVRHLAGLVGEAAAAIGAGNRAVGYRPVAIVLPAVEVLAVEQ